MFGPPGAGKTTYVLEHSEPGDVVVDTDWLYRALTGLELYEKPGRLLPVVMAARDAAVAAAVRSQVRKVWIVASGATDDDRRRDCPITSATWTLICPDRDECVRRIQRDDRRQEYMHLWIGRVDRWFERFAADSKNSEGADRPPTAARRTFSRREIDKIFQGGR